ncbi:autotransporter domain-containing SGNH/GDSL hydrolase family protein [Pseudomonas sp. GOM6]|uniref:autotransporter domain-containing SGNH/GDSL hydrolase family protein n=1 Tax=Pseudomonas sp. GOM6 TaxID=3036944 RepID=UPI002409932C|nr:autotransporter domain-containing SGNH/GDSL hydrolase family protein [Pseudomonas sp. GOM6]MDG1579785.1 autotransporter domain-containing protein [Pseudomonas sp. GOM6]
MKRVLTPLALACLLAGPSSIHAAAYSGMVVFGDSLSDAGQFAIGSNPIRFTTQTGPSYSYFSTEAFGSSSPMLIGEGLGLGQQTASTSALRQSQGLADGDNWAVGGYTTAQIYRSITQPGGSVVASGGVPLRTRDGYLAGGRVANSDTLFYVNGGGNDFLQGLVVSVPTAEAAAVRLGDSLRALQAAGARYIMTPLLVDVPNPSTGGAFNQAQFALSQAYNAELVRQMASVDAEVIPLNVPLLYREVLASPAAFGFDARQNLQGTCFYAAAITGATGCQNATWGSTSATPDPSKLIYADLVHPTTAMQQILADQGLSILAAPWEVSLLPQAADTALDNARAKLQQQWLGDWGRWQAIGQWRGFADGGVSRSDFDGADTSAEGDGKGKTLNLGASYRLDQDWRLGLALAVEDQDLELGARDSEYGLRSYLASAFAQYDDGQLWGDLTLSAGYLDYHSLERRFALGITTRTEEGDTDGQTLAIGGRLGIDLAATERLRLRPFISADYAHTEVNGYRESGASSTALSYDDQTLESKRLGVGLQARFALAADAELFGEIAREYEFENDQQDVEMQLNSVSGLDFELKGYEPDADVTRATLGLRQQLAKDLAWQLGYSYQHSGDDDQHGISLGLVLDW